MKDITIALLLIFGLFLDAVLIINVNHFLGWSAALLFFIVCAWSSSLSLLFLPVDI